MYVASASPIEKQFELNMHSNGRIWSNSYDQVNSNQAWQVETKCMLFTSWNRDESRHASDQVQFQTKQAYWNKCMSFIDGIKSKISMRSSDHVKSDLTLQVEANHMLFVNEIKLNVSMHSSNHVNSNLNKLIEAS